MFPYFAMIGLPSLFAVLTQRRQPTSVLLVLIFVMFVTVMGLRFEIGPDWFNYSTHFQRYHTMSIEEIVADGEVGWGLLLVVANFFNWGMTGIVMVSAIVFCIGLFSLARSCQEPMLVLVGAMPYLGLAVAMSGLRQAMAIGVIFFLMSRWYRTSLPTKAFGILVAASFHFSAVAVLPIIVLESRMSQVQRLLITGILGLLVLYLVGIAEARVEEYSANYLEGEAANAPGAVFHVALTAGPAFVYFMLRQRWLRTYGKVPIIDWFAAIGVAAFAVVFLFPTATDRMTLYFSGVALVIQANLPQMWANRSEQFMVRATLIVLNVAAMSTFLLAGNKASAFVPYQSIFSDATLTSSRTYNAR